LPKYYRIFKVAKCLKGEKKLSVKKKLFFSSVLEKKMNDKRNLIFRNVMLLSQSRGEIFSVYFAKNFGFERKKNQSLR